MGIELSKECLDWLKQYSSGYHFTRIWRIIWATTDEKIVLIKQPGETWYDNMGGHYGPVNHSLVNTRIPNNFHRGKMGKQIADFRGRYNANMRILIQLKLRGYNDTIHSR